MNHVHLLVLVFLLASGAASPSQAVMFVVNTANDTNDVALGNGACADAAGLCSVRAAVQETNALASADQILIPAGNYVITIAGMAEQFAVTGDLDIRDRLTIIGAGPLATIIDGNALDRVFDIHNARVRISRMRITNGNAVTFDGGGVRNNAGRLSMRRVRVENSTGSNGGGIYSDGPIQMHQVRVAGNTGSSGGGMMLNGLVAPVNARLRGCAFDSNVSTALGGAMTVTEGARVRIGLTRFLTNTAATSGGAIRNIGETRCFRCTFDGNSTLSGGAIDSGAAFAGVPSSLLVSASTLSNNVASGGEGGAIRNYQGSVDIDSSTFDSNSAGSGGGLQNNGTGAVTIVNSTFSGNVAAGGGGLTDKGGGIFNKDGTLELSSVTIFGNTADTGGGVYSNQSGIATVTMRNTIIEGNTALLTGPDCDDNGVAGSNEPWISAGYNFVGDIVDSSYVAGVGDQTGDSSGAGAISPMLGALAANGGPALTHALLVGSTAIDAGDPAGCTDGAALLTADQRGFPKPTDGDGDGIVVCDVGAFEL